MSTSVRVPTTYTFNVELGSNGETIHVDADLDNIRVKEIPDIHVKEMPRIEFAIKEMPQYDVAVKELPQVDIAVKEMPRIEFAVKELPQIDIAIKEIPSVRAHVPSHYDLGLSILGLEVLRFSLCGETQVITEKYVPRRSEACR